MTFMRTRLGLLLTFVAALELLSSPAIAQPRCETTETLEQCWNHYLPDAAASLEAADTELREVDSGVDVGDEGSTSSLINTLSRFGFTGVFNDSDGVTGDDGRMAFDFSFLLPGGVRDRNGKLQAFVAMDAGLFEPLKMLLPEAERDQRISDLQEQIGDVDDYALSFTYNILSNRWGRTIEAHRETYARLFNQIDIPEIGGTTAFLTFLTMLPDEAGSSAEQKTFEALGTLSESLTAEDLMHAFEGAAAAEAGLEQDFVAEAQLLFENFKYLVNNQPQLLISAEHRGREELVGPDETSLEISWEQPLGPNVNRFLSYDPDGSAGPCESNPGDCSEAFRNYIERKKGKVDNTDRAVFSLSYTDIGDYSIFRPNDGLAVDGEPFRVEGGERLKVLAGWGRSFDRGPAEEALAPSRLDIAVSYEDLFDDPERQDRFIASLTYTVKLNDGMSLPVGLVYANKPEFLAMENVDEEITARLGLKLTLPGGNPQENGDGSN